MIILTFVRPRAAPPATRPGRAPEESFQNEEFEEEELLLLAMMGITLSSLAPQLPVTMDSFCDLCLSAPIRLTLSL